ncbi:MAG: twin-arginine translocation signal domain-containing protein [Desulfobacterales bacterium]
MAGKGYSRRDFVRTSAAAAAGAAAGMAASNLSAADKQKILNYNENMEYRPWGKTGLMVSSVCLGGHWKRIDKVVPSCNKGRGGWLGFDINDPALKRRGWLLLPPWHNVVGQRQLCGPGASITPRGR